MFNDYIYAHIIQNKRRLYKGYYAIELQHVCYMQIILVIK